jgi:hypothetical protein
MYRDLDFPDRQPDRQGLDLPGNQLANALQSVTFGNPDSKQR